MPSDNTLTATPAMTPTVEQLQAENTMLKEKLASAEQYIRKLETRPSLHDSFAQQLFLQNLTQVNDPNMALAWERTEAQLKFLESKLG